MGEAEMDRHAQHKGELLRMGCATADGAGAHLCGFNDRVEAMLSTRCEPSSSKN